MKSLPIVLAISFLSPQILWFFAVLSYKFLLSVSSVLLFRDASILWVSINSASFICLNLFLCFSSSCISKSSMASIWACSKALPTKTYKTGSTSSSKSNRSGSLSCTWIFLSSPSGLGIKIGEGYNYKLCSEYWSIDVVVWLQLFLVHHVILIRKLLYTS